MGGASHGKIAILNKVKSIPSIFVQYMGCAYPA